MRVNKEPVMNYVESFEYEEIVRLNEWKGQQQRDKEKQAALRASMECLITIIVYEI